MRALVIVYPNCSKLLIINYLPTQNVELFNLCGDYQLDRSFWCFLSNKLVTNIV